MDTQHWFQNRKHKIEEAWVGQQSDHDDQNYQRFAIIGLESEPNAACVMMHADESILIGHGGFRCIVVGTCATQTRPGVWVGKAPETVLFTAAGFCGPSQAEVALSCRFIVGFVCC